MNVAELIELLQKIENKNLLVHFVELESGSIYAVDDVSLTSDAEGDFIIIETNFGKDFMN